MLLFSLNSCITRDNTYGVIDTPVVCNDGKYIACIVAESEGLTHQENGGYRETNYRTSYWLKQYETATGKLLKKKKLLGHTDNPDIGCYGSFDNKIWLYMNGIKAYDMNSLEEVTDEEKMAKANGVKKTLFPYGSRLVNPSVENGYIDFTADDGEQYRLQLKDVKIVNKESIKNREANTARIINRLLHNDDYGARCDTFGNAVFILAKDIAAAEQCSPNNNNIQAIAYRMKLFTAGYTVTQLGSHGVFNYQNISQAGEATYLNPCFAKDTEHDKVIHPANPGGYLLIHQDTLGEKSKAIFTRIGTGNKKAWETTSDVSTKISACISSGKYCIITTNKDYMLSPHLGKDALCIIDTETGNIIKPAISE